VSSVKRSLRGKVGVRLSLLSLLEVKGERGKVKGPEGRGQRAEGGLYMNFFLVITLSGHYALNMNERRYP